MRGEPAPLIVALAGLMVVLFCASLVVGPAGIGVGESLAALVTGEDSLIGLVMREVRLPRALLAVMIGASLGLSGAVLQGLLRNPLAEPGVLGVSAAASLGAVIAIYTGLAAAFTLALPLTALLGALIAVFGIQALAGRRAEPLTVVLAGVALTSLAGALTSLVLNLSDNPFAAVEIVFWLLGSLADRSMTHVWLALPLTLLGWVLLGLTGRGLDALSLGEGVAASLGVDLGRLRVLAVVGTAAAVGAATAVAGAIGFVGLVIPHLLRPLVGAKPSRLLLASALGGACLILAADIGVRVILPGRDLKLGVVTALVGAPFFLWLILKARRGWV